MAGDLQCFECVMWSEIAKCARHGTADDEKKRDAHAREAMLQLFRRERA